VTDISENAHRVAAPVLKARRVIVSQSGITYIGLPSWNRDGDAGPRWSRWGHAHGKTRGI